MNAKVTIETITPTQAKKWLENRFEGQRKVRENHVHRMASDISNGKWHLTPDAFSLIRGKLANGQHRCEAIVLADTACDALVMRSDDEALFNVMDSGVGRKAYDVLQQSGISDGGLLATAARNILSYKMGNMSRGGERPKKIEGTKIRAVVTRQDVIDYVADNAGQLTEFAGIVKKLYNKNPIIAKAWALTFLMLATPLYGEAALKFINSVYKGMDEKTAYIRDRLIKTRTVGGRANPYYTFAVLIKAFRAYVDGAKFSQIKIGEAEGFPTL